MFDADRSGQIGFDEFAALYKYIQVRLADLPVPEAYLSDVQEWQGVFRRFDADRSGTIQAAELQAAIGAFGFNVSPRIIGILDRKYGAPDARLLAGVAHPS
jgi:hypothetical protein